MYNYENYSENIDCKMSVTPAQLWVEFLHYYFIITLYYDYY